MRNKKSKATPGAVRSMNSKILIWRDEGVRKEVGTADLCKNKQPLAPSPPLPSTSPALWNITAGSKTNMAVLSSWETHLLRFPRAFHWSHWHLSRILSGIEQPYRTRRPKALKSVHISGDRAAQRVLMVCNS